MQNNAFTPFGPTYLVGTTTPTQALASNNLTPTAYRVRNTSSSANYLAWSPVLLSGNVPTSMQPVAPAAGSPSINTVGMIGASVEVFQLPGNCWFIGGAAGFEVTPGEGI